MRERLRATRKMREENGVAKLRHTAKGNATRTGSGVVQPLPIRLLVDVPMAPGGLKQSSSLKQPGQRVA